MEPTWFYAKKDGVPIRDSYYAIVSSIVRKEEKERPLYIVTSLINSVMRIRL